MRGGFIGRDRELGELAAGLEGAFSGRGAIFLLAGEPGIGKTALAERFANHATERGARVVWSRSWEGGDAAPYWLWAQIIRAVIEAADEETLASLLSHGMGHIALLVPELADRFGSDANSIRAIDSEAGRFYLFESTARFLKQASSTTPLVLLLDDVLAGDRPSLQLLRFVARDVRASRILVVATHRDSGPPPSGEAVELLADLVREGYVLNLRGLDRAEVGRLIAEVAGVAPWKGTVSAIHEATAGNPLFVREVTRLLAASEALDRPRRSSIPVPDSVRAVIRRRLTPLSADAIQVLSAAAVVGRDFDLAWVDAACNLPGDRILAAIAHGTALGVIAQAPEGERIYRFTHPLMREAIYDGLPIAARAQIHQVVAAAIERLHGTDSTSHLGELAYHFAKASSIEQSGKALEYASRAGDRALKAFAYEEAVVQYRRALDALRLSGRPDAALRCELLLRLGRAQARIADYSASKSTFLQAADHARELGDAEQLARAALGFGEPQVEGGLVNRQLVDLLEEASVRLSVEDSALRARVVARLAMELTFADESALREIKRESLSLEALEIARRVGDVGALIAALRARWLTVWGPDGLAERTALCNEMLALAHDTGDREIELNGRSRRVTGSLESGDTAAIEVDMTAHALIADELRMPYHMWAAAAMRTGKALLIGRLDRVERLAHTAEDHLPGRPNAFHAHINQLTVLRWEQGRLGELYDAWQRTVEQFPQLAFARGWVALAAAEVGRGEAAREALQELVGAIPKLPRNGVWLPALALGALAAAQLDEPDAAARLYPILRPYAEHNIIISMPHPVLCFGSASLYLGLLAAVLRAWDDAEHHFEAAIAANQQLAAKPFLARTYGEYARMLMQRQHGTDRARAAELLERAAVIADSIGLASLSSTIDKLRVPATATAVSERVDEAPADTRRHMFRREGEYWTVAHDGVVVRLRDCKGLRCLAQLLACPGREFPALVLEALEGEPQTPRPVTAGRATHSDELGLRAHLGDAGALLDARAKADYRERIAELRADLDEAESFNDPGRATRAQEELDFLAGELSRAVGLGGRDRRAASHAERARLNVTRAIRSTMRTLTRVQPALAEHLAATVRTGRYCSYTPDPRAPITWEI